MAAGKWLEANGWRQMAAGKWLWRNAAFPKATETNAENGGLFSAKKKCSGENMMVLKKTAGYNNYNITMLKRKP